MIILNDHDVNNNSFEFILIQLAIYWITHVRFQEGKFVVELLASDHIGWVCLSYPFQASL